MKYPTIIYGLIIFAFSSCYTNLTNTKKVNHSTTEQITFINQDSLVNKATVTNEFELFWLRDLEESVPLNVAFISLSDKYYTDEHKDSSNFPNLDEVLLSDQLYFELSAEYRKRFFSVTNIAEEDSVFIYDYSTDQLLSFQVKDLDLVAYLNMYMDTTDCPCSEFDYMIGFEINKKHLTGFKKYYAHSLVAVAKTNPFIRGQLKAMTWEKIEVNDFPITKSNQENPEFSQQNLKKGNAYVYNTEEFQYFIQEYTPIKNSYDLSQRHIIVISKKDGELIIDRWIRDSEGIRVAPLNFGIDNSSYKDLKEQWTGQLFKGKPQVVFGFEWVSFGCPNFIFLNSQEKDIYINCDNRH